MGAKNGGVDDGGCEERGVVAEIMAVFEEDQEEAEEGVVKDLAELLEKEGVEGPKAAEDVKEGPCVLDFEELQFWSFVVRP